MVLFTTCFALGVWLLQQQTSLPALGWAWLLLGLPFALLIPARPFALRAIRTLLIAVLAMGIGFYHAAWQAEQRLAVTLPDQWQGRDIEVVGVVAELPRKFEQGLHFSFDVEKVLTPQAHLYLSTYYSRNTESPELHAGERWQLTVRLKQPHGSSNPHGFDFELWALENNVRAVGYVNNKAPNLRLAGLAGGFNYRIQYLREHLRDKLAAARSGAPYAGVLTALAIGDRRSAIRAASHRHNGRCLHAPG
jgi:competence protein ComEC